MFKIVHLTLITNIPTSTKKELNKMKTKKPKTKHTTLCNLYDNNNIKMSTYQ